MLAQPPRNRSRERRWRERIEASSSQHAVDRCRRAAFADLGDGGRDPRSFLINLVAILATVAQAVAQETTIGAATPAVPVFVTPGGVRSGALLLKSDNDRYVEALVGTDVDLVVSGPTRALSVTQQAS